MWQTVVAYFVLLFGFVEFVASMNREEWISIRVQRMATSVFATALGALLIVTAP